MSGIVCTEPDAFVQLRWLSQASWIAELSDGSLVYQDDGRPGQEQSRPAWLRLGDHLKATGLSIVELWLRFREHDRHPLPRNAPGYFCRQSWGGFPSSGVTQRFLLIGYLTDSQIVVQHWSNPGLTLVEVDYRDPRDVEKVGESLLLASGVFLGERP